MKVAAQVNIFFGVPTCVCKYCDDCKVLSSVATQTPPKTTINVRDATKDLGAHNWFWFTSIDEITNNDFFTAAIWSQTQNDEVKPLLEMSSII